MWMEVNASDVCERFQYLVMAACDANLQNNAAIVLVTFIMVMPFHIQST